MAFKNFTQKKVQFNVNTEGFKFTSHKDLEKDKVYDFLGCFITTGKYGKQAVIITNGMLVNCPSHMVKVVEDILNDDEAIADINNGHAGFKTYDYTDKKYNRACVGIDLVSR